MSSIEEDTTVITHASGRLEGTDVPTLIRNLWERAATGTLSLERDGVRKRIHFLGGEIVFADSSRPDDRLGETLLRAGVISFTALEEGIERLGSGMRLGEALVHLGWLQSDDVPRLVTGQLRDIVFSVFPWESGSFEFTPDVLRRREPISLEEGTARLLADGTRRVSDWNRIRQAVGRMRTRYRQTEGAAERAVGMTLDPEEREVLGWTTEPLSVGEICSSVTLDNFRVFQILWSLRLTGLISVCDESDMTGDRCESGRLETRGLARILASLCRRGETGLLVLRRGPEEKTIHLKEGRVVFATSNSPADSLTNYLLSRGIVGVSEIEQVERRLLSGKRLGTMLVETGALAKGEMGRYVQLHLEEIVHSVFAWEEGQYRFEDGELPRIEDLGLKITLENLVLTGVRRVRDWSRILEGCGGPTAQLVIKRSGAELLNMLENDPDVAEIVDILSSPTSIRDLCETSRLPDFTVCQIAWGLRELDAAVLFHETTDAGILQDSPAGESAGPSRLAAAVCELDDELGDEAAIAAGGGPEAGTLSPADLLDIVRETQTGPEETVTHGEPVTEVAETPSDEEILELTADDEITPAGDTTQAGTGAAAAAEAGEGDGSTTVTGTDETIPLTFQTIAMKSPSGSAVRKGNTQESSVRAGADAEDGPGDSEDPGSAPEQEAKNRADRASGGIMSRARSFMSSWTAASMAPELFGGGAARKDPAGTPDDRAGAEAPEGDANEPARPDAGDTTGPETGTTEEVSSGEPAADPDYEPDAGILAALRSFNDDHRKIFDATRVEIGAGTVNFLQNSRWRLREDQARVLRDGHITRTGNWDPETLERSLHERGVDEAKAVLEALIRAELETVREVLPAHRFARLEEEVRQDGEAASF